MVKVNVKWGKESYEVDVEQNASSDDFRVQLYSLTNVPVDKQKIMGFKGGLLKNGVNLSDNGLVEGLKVTLIGTAEERHLAAPAAGVVFEEDLTAEKRRALLTDDKVGGAAVGMQNMGNTCYMNSTLQFLRPANGLVKSISTSTAANGNIPVALKGVYSTLTTGTQAFAPTSFIINFKNAHSQFNNLEQQDAEEFLQSVLQDVDTKDIINNQFGIGVESELTPLEGSSTASEFAADLITKLPVFCGNQTTPVNHLHEGLKLSLEENITKTSEGREIAYKKTTRVASLPPYLLTQFVRFEWKQAHVLAGTEAGKAKINRKISFPLKFDLWEFMSSGLKKRLAAVRDILTERAEKATETPPATTTAAAEPQSASSAAAAANEVIDGDFEWNGLKAGVPVETGFFELCSVVSHIGRSADSGHYIGWVRKFVIDTQGKDSVESDPEPSIEDKWLKFDDDKVTETPFKETYLEGGHQNANSAYLLMYRKRFITPTASEIKNAKKAADAKNGKDVEMVEEDKADQEGMTL